jgi:hypothetical protein
MANVTKKQSTSKSNLFAQDERIQQALEILKAVGLPKGQHNERSALTLLALADVTPATQWEDAARPQRGVTPMMEWINENYGRKYAPNTRETIRRQTLHQFVDACVALYNPDCPTRPVNSPKAAYQLDETFWKLIQNYGNKKWEKSLRDYLGVRQKLSEAYAKERQLRMVPIQLPAGEHIELSPGGHSELTKKVLEEFAARFAPGSLPVYVGDTGDKWAYFNQELLADLGVELDGHGKMPDVVLFCPQRKWILLIECVTSHGPVDPKRHSELERLFAKSKAGVVYVTAFPSRQAMAGYLTEIAWETEVWTAENPSHLIHFNGVRFLGPYGQQMS